MLRLISFTVLFVLAVFVLPSLAHLAVWAAKDRPARWSEADWSSASVLPNPPVRKEAAIYVMAARTGGLKGAFATHSWLVLKQPGAERYDRYDVVGWGRPVRKNSYPADGRWYSNIPSIQHAISGAEAASLIPRIEAEIANYRWSRSGDYSIWPGPNSNTFVAHILRTVPGLRATTPSTAVGRDYPSTGQWLGRTANGSLYASLAGYAGLMIGEDTGLEINFLGLVAGINPMRGEIKVPAFGSYRLY